MSNKLLIVRDKVQKILSSNFNRVEIDRDGDITLRHESARMFVRCWAKEEDDAPVIVAVESPLLLRVKPTPELFKHIALHSDDYVFGHLSAREGDDGVLVLFSYNLLGDYLDEEELLRACFGVLGTANDLDDELQSKFGGERFHED
jgi:hypothetical protein